MGKKIILCLLVIVLISAFSLEDSLAGISGEIRTLAGGYDINGYTRSSSYYQGGWYREELDLRLTEVKIRDLDLESFLSVRFTDDKYIDTETSSIEKMYARLTGEKFGLELGDFYANFTNYSINQSLKGIGGWMDLGFLDLDGVKLSGIFGVTKQRWEDFYKELDSEVYTRYVSGFRVNKELNKDTSVGFNFTNAVDDDNGSVPSSSTKGIDNQLVSLDARMKLFDKLNIDSEIAHSWYDPDVRDEDGKRSDFAVKLNTNLDFGKLKFINNYEMVGPNFGSPAGVVSVDRREYLSKITYKPNKTIKTRLSYTILKDNLNKQKSTTTTTTVPRIDVTLKPIQKMKYLKLDLSYDERRLVSGDGTTTDQSTKTSYIGIRNKVKRVNFSCGYCHRRKEDDITDTNERDIDIWNVGAKTSFDMRDIRFSPGVTYSIEKDKQVTDKEIDTLQITNLRLYISFPKGTSLNLRYNLSDNDMNPLGKDEVRTRASVDFRTYLFGDRDKLLTFSYEMRDYEKEDASRSYTENLFESKLAFKF